MIYARNVITITGIMPDNVLPIASPNSDPTSIYLYYRTDGKLYEYDLKTHVEYDLFYMDIDISNMVHVVNPFNNS
jgi:hypothetical protein